MNVSLRSNKFLGNLLRVVLVGTLAMGVATQAQANNKVGDVFLVDNSAGSMQNVNAACSSVPGYNFGLVSQVTTGSCTVTQLVPFTFNCTHQVAATGEQTITVNVDGLSAPGCSSVSSSDIGASGGSCGTPSTFTCDSSTTK